MIDERNSPVLYIDANPFIYFVDGEERLANRIRPIFALLTHKAGLAATSELTLAEVLAKARPDIRRSYLDLLIRSRRFVLHPVTRDILIETAKYRQVSQRRQPDGKVSKVKLPDAIHVVTAMQLKCRMFLSADQSLRLPAGMSMLTPDEAGLAKLNQALI
jgi:predicted nucleic acid-binding protein